ncbi:MAG: transcriptional repressor NrdR [Candidatus Coatesbacteria bacterium]|nr:transcriptional repressor NrdR [Candidatus Coatesbacteria bacterium]
MRCPYCGQDDDRVIDTRPSRGGESIRRRRECLACSRRFTTYETVEEPELYVIKNDGGREPFDREKVRRGLARACEKRPVSKERLDELVAALETDLRNRLVGEVPSREIGEWLMRELAEIDEVAYVRFASVYRRFTDGSQFAEELRRLTRTRKKRRARRAKKPLREQEPPLFDLERD